VSVSNQQQVLPTVGRKSGAAQAPVARQGSPFRSGFALRAIAEFECIGSACEDTCCSGWSVPLSRDDLVRLKRATRADLEMRRSFAEAVDERTDAPVQGATGQLSMGADGYCAFLDREKLCKVQNSSGSDSIPTVCGLYPRRISSIGSRLEMTPLASCPEATRRLLLQPDGVELVEVDPAHYPRIVANHIVPDRSADPFERHMDDVRNVILELLRQPDIPFAVRFLFTTALADGVHGFFGRNHPAFDTPRLAATLSQFTDAENLAQIWRSFDETAPEYTLGASVAYQVIAPKANGSRKLTELFARAMSTYGPETGLEAAFTERAIALDNALGDRWDAYFTRLSINYWVQSYLDADSLLEHCRALAIQLQAIRFLVLGEPPLDQVRLDVEASAASPEALAKAFDEAFVRVVYRFARATEHDPDFCKSVNSALDSNGFAGLGHIVRLIPRDMAS
jgi:lysine-N-methylase